MVKGGQYVVTATATNVTTALSLTSGDLPSGGFHCTELSIKNADGAVNKVYLGGSGVTNVPANAHVELAAGMAYSYMPSQSARVNTDEIYIVGTANAANIVFIEMEI